MVKIIGGVGALGTGKNMKLFRGDRVKMDMSSIAKRSIDVRTK